MFSGARKTTLQDQKLPRPVFVHTIKIENKTTARQPRSGHEAPQDPRRQTRGRKYCMPCLKVHRPHCPCRRQAGREQRAGAVVMQLDALQVRRRQADRRSDIPVLYGVGG